MENSEIEWTHNTFNPWMGCAKVSPGCKNCYAQTLMDTRYGRVEWGPGKPRVRTGPDNWKLPARWNRAAAKLSERPRVFCASLADWLDDEVPIEWLADLLQLVAVCTNLNWLLLSKRPENWRKRMVEVLKIREIPMVERWLEGTAFGHVWIGTSAESQKYWDMRLPQILEIPAVVSFVSAEPLLGPIKMGKLRPEWLIVGGESGGGARPMESAWVRDLRDECKLPNKLPVAFHFKQWGGVNKVVAGRKLDGRTWDELPVRRVGLWQVRLAA